MFKIREWLYIGDYHDLNDLTLLSCRGIGAILCLEDPIDDPGIPLLHLQIRDGERPAPDKLASGIHFLRKQKALGRRVVSMCGAGISRSVTFAIGALMEEENLTWQQAYDTILDHHPDAMPHPEILQALLAHEGQPVPDDQVIWVEEIKIQLRHG